MGRPSSENLLRCYGTESHTRRIVAPAFPHSMAHSESVIPNPARTDLAQAAAHTHRTSDGHRVPPPPLASPSRQNRVPSSASLTVVLRLAPPPTETAAPSITGAQSPPPADSSRPPPRQMDPLEFDGATKKSNRPKYSKFTQQELSACKPLLTPGIVIAAFALIGVLFVPIGLASLSASREIVEVVDRYDVSCGPMDDKVGFIQNSKSDKTCTRTLTVPKYMKSPIHIHYQIGDFYQNHRRYVKSRSDKQLRYKNAVHLTKDCEPEGNTSDGAPIVPCGLVAWSMFNDTYTIMINKKAIEVNKKDIAWKSDKNNKFGNDIYPSNFQKGVLIGGAKLNESIPLSEQEDLIVWMRTAALPTFRKLYGRIETDIMANDQITVVIQNNYNTYSFGGSKALVLSTSSWIGGKNNFIGIAYLIIGGLCLLLAVGFIFLYMVKPRNLGDPSYLSWNRDE